MRDVIADKKYVLNRLEVYDIKAEKKYGQNFLVDDSLAKAIVDSLNVNKDDTVIEIGPGLGALSYHLAELASTSYLCEVDQLMVEHLNNIFTEENIKIIHQDFLKLPLEDFAAPLTIVGNLPYYITTPILDKLIANSTLIKKMVLMVQKEVFARVSAKIGTKDYGPLAIFVEYLGGAKILKRVSRHAYLPEPHIDSLVFIIDVNKKQRADNEKLFYHLTKTLFLMRRKTILNNLTSYLNSKEKAVQILQDMNINTLARPEDLNLEFYLGLAKRLC